MHLLPIYYLCTLTTLHVFSISFLHTKDLLRTSFYIIPAICTKHTMHLKPTIHTVPTIHAKHTIHIKHTIHDIIIYMPYSPYPSCQICCHTYTTRPRMGTSLCLTRDHAGGTGVGTLHHTYMYVYR